MGYIPVQFSYSMFHGIYPSAIFILSVSWDISRCSFHTQCFMGYIVVRFSYPIFQGYIRVQFLYSMFHGIYPSAIFILNLSLDISQCNFHFQSFMGYIPVQFSYSMFHGVYPSAIFILNVSWDISQSNFHTQRFYRIYPSAIFILNVSWDISQCNCHTQWFMGSKCSLHINFAKRLITLLNLSTKIALSRLLPHFSGRSEFSHCFWLQ